MDAFAVTDPLEQAEAFAEAAARMGVATIIVEKDFWVCWGLKRLFELDAPGDGFLFKGGTSLSKAYGLIERFSEDIDVSLDREGLGFGGDDDPANIHGSNARKRKIADLAAATADHVQRVLLPRLLERMEATLEGRPFALTTDADDPQTLLFEYPRSASDAPPDAYIRPVVRFEFGGRADHEPVEERVLTPYLFDHFPDLVAAPEVVVRTLAAIRTFWEKATILHEIALRDPDKALGERASRHYSDLARMIAAGTGAEALERPELLDAVARHKATFFRTGGDPYSTAKIGTLRLAPPAHLADRLKTDYDAMGEMFFGEAPEWSDVLRMIEDFERRANASR